MPCESRILQSPIKGQVKLVLWETGGRSLPAQVLGGCGGVVKKRGGLRHSVTQPPCVMRVSRKRAYTLRILVDLESETA